jgi:hypothetical protein
MYMPESYLRQGISLARLAGSRGGTARPRKMVVCWLAADRGSSRRSAAVAPGEWPRG